MQGTKLGVPSCEQSVLTGDQSNILFTAMKVRVTTGFSGGRAFGGSGRVASVSQGEKWVASFRNIRRLDLPMFGSGPGLGTVALPFYGR